MLRSQNGAFPNTNLSIYSTETTCKSFFTVIQSGVLTLLRKSKNDGVIRRNMLFMDPA